MKNQKELERQEEVSATLKEQQSRMKSDIWNRKVI